MSTSSSTTQDPVVVEVVERPIAELSVLRDVNPPAGLVARVMTKLEEPRTPSMWQWLHRPFSIEIRLSPADADHADAGAWRRVRVHRRDDEVGVPAGRVVTRRAALVMGAAAVGAALLRPARLRAAAADRKLLYVQPLGDELPAADAALVATAIESLIGWEVRTLDRIPLPADAFYKPRRRWRADKLLDVLDGRLPKGGTRILGLTGADISTTKGDVFDWGVLGLGRIDGASGVISLFRCRKGARAPRARARAAGQGRGPRGGAHAGPGPLPEPRLSHGRRRRTRRDLRPRVRLLRALPEAAGQCRAAAARDTRHPVEPPRLSGPEAV